MEMKLLIIAVIVLLIAIPTYPHWSYKAWNKRCEEKKRQNNDLEIASYCADHDCLTCRFQRQDGSCRIHEVFNT